MEQLKPSKWQLLTYIIVGLIGFGVFFADPVSAAEESITLSPPKKHFTIKAGETITDELTVINYGDTAYDFIVYSAPYSVKDTEYTPDFTTMTENGDAYKWVRFNQTRWHAEPKATIKVPYSITASPGAIAGGHYGVIFVETQPSSESQGVARKKRLAMIMYANVDGPTTTAGATKSIVTNWFQAVAPLQSQVLIENTGKTDFNGKTTFVVKDLFGNLKLRDEKDSTVLPGTERRIDHVWDNPAWVGVYLAHTESVVLGQKQSHDSLIILMPRWLIFVVALTVLILVARAVQNRDKRSQRKTSHKIKRQ